MSSLNFGNLLKGKKVLAVLAIAVIALALYANFESGTIFGVSQIYVEPQGLTINGGSVSGSYWNIVASVTMNDNLAGIVLPENQAATVDYQGVSTALKTGANIEIKIDPQQPYLVKQLTERTVKVAPEAVGGGVTAPEVWLNFYDWAEPSFHVYAPYTVTVFKDGQQIGQATLDTAGADTTQLVQTSEGAIRIEHLGSLVGSYMTPDVPAEIAIFKSSPNIYNYDSISGYVESSSTFSDKYVNYWYGSARNGAGQAYNPTMSIGGGLGNVYAPSAYGGWSGSDFGGNAQPVKPVITTTEKSALPENERSFRCLTEYLEQSKAKTNLANTIFSKYSSVEFLKDSSNRVHSIKLNVPWSAFTTPMVNIRVPTELADTWVDRPPVADVQPTVSWESTGSKYLSTTGSARLKVDLTQNSEVLSACRVAVQCSNAKVGVYPTEMAAVSIEPGATETVYFTITNLGVTTQISNIPIDIIVYEKYTGQETGRDQAYITLLPTLSHETTGLNVLAVEKGTGNKITGLQLQVNFGGQTLIAFTDGNGKANFNLETTNGGGYAGPITVQSIEDSKYLSASASTTVNYGSNEFTLEVPLKGIDYGDDWSWLVWFAIPLTAGILGFLFLKTRRQK